MLRGGGRYRRRTEDCGAGGTVEMVGLGKAGQRLGKGVGVGRRRQGERLKGGAGE